MDVSLRAAQAKWAYWENPEKYRARSRAWRVAHPEKAKEINRRAYARLQQSGWFRGYHLQKKFGLTTEAYDELWVEQLGLCAICHKPETVCEGPTLRELAVDHCHRTAKIRGLLCDRCNRGLGYFQDSCTHLIAATDYLKGVNG